MSDNKDTEIMLRELLQKLEGLEKQNQLLMQEIKSLKDSNNALTYEFSKANREIKKLKTLEENQAAAFSSFRR